MQQSAFDLADLPQTEQSLLWAIRTWVTGRWLGEDMGAKIDAILQHTGLIDAAPPLEGFLWVLSQGLTKSLEVNCTCQSDVSPDEARLLAIFGCLAEDRCEEAEAFLLEITSERAMLLAIDCASRVALQFRTADHGSALSSAQRRRGRVVAIEPQAWMVH